VGDFIVYAGLADRSGVLRAGQIIELTYSKTDYGDPEPKVRVKSWNNYRAEKTSWNDEDFEASGRQKDTTLSFLDRLIVVPESYVSEKVKKDLAGPVADYMGRPIK
jgi:hypothetical protein